jgi:hypothetical protein
MLSIAFMLVPNIIDTLCAKRLILFDIYHQLYIIEFLFFLTNSEQLLLKLTIIISLQSLWKQQLNSKVLTA